jgi:hypothetical protein
MHDGGQSDGPVVPEKPPNNARGGAAEAVEGRGPAKENAASATRPGLSAGVSVPNGLDRVRQAAQKDREAQFTALLHHRQEPSAVVPHAGICAGGRQQRRSLPRPSLVGYPGPVLSRRNAKVSAFLRVSARNRPE